MEKQLFLFFDYQKYAENSALQSLIDFVHAGRSARRLTMEEANMVNAAGSAMMPHRQNPSVDRK